MSLLFKNHEENDKENNTLVKVNNFNNLSQTAHKIT